MQEYKRVRSHASKGRQIQFTDFWLSFVVWRGAGGVVNYFILFRCGLIVMEGLSHALRTYTWRLEFNEMAWGGGDSHWTTEVATSAASRVSIPTFLH